ncbi:secreted protein [Cutibacterium acnes JCM 18918]|nr:secreted protein [Cutibacterium acnes JCM 18918]
MPCIGAATGGAVSVTNPSTSDLVVVNSDIRAATVDVTMLGPKGEIVTAGMRGIRVSPGQTKVLPMSVWDNGATPVTALVNAREGRVVVGARMWAGQGHDTSAMTQAAKTLFFASCPCQGVDCNPYHFESRHETVECVGDSAGWAWPLHP